MVFCLSYIKPLICSLISVVEAYTYGLEQYYGLYSDLAMNLPVLYSGINSSCFYEVQYFSSSIGLLY